MFLLDNFQFSFAKRRVLVAWVLLAPMLFTLFLVAALPLCRNFFFSFTDVSINDLSEWQFIFFRNYIDYFNGEWYGLLVDELWWKAVWKTIIFTAISVPLETIFGLCVALMLNKKFVGRGLLRAAILVPWATPTIVSSKMWDWMLNDQFGIINDLMMKVNFIDAPIAWTSGNYTAMIAVILVDVWKTTPFMALLILAGLQTLPKHCYKVAAVDGIPPLSLFFRFTLPMLKPSLVVALIFRSLDALRVFDLIYVLTPNNEATSTMSVFARQYLFELDRFGYGSAASVFLFLFIAVVTLIGVKIGNLGLDK